MQISKSRARRETMQTQLDTGFVRNHAKRDLQKLSKKSEKGEKRTGIIKSPLKKAKGKERSQRSEPDFIGNSE